MLDSTTKHSFYVYKITNRLNQKVYIGVTSRTLHIRWKQHIRDARTSDLAIHRAFNKYGIENFIMELIEECPDHPTMLERERYWIQQYNSMLPNGYNITAGGQGLFGMHHTEETKRKISAKPITPEFRARMRDVANERALNPEYLEKISKANTGRKTSEEAKEKIRAARAKQVFTPEVIEKRVQKIRGMKHTDAARANMSKAQKGRTFSAEHRQKISNTLGRLTNEEAAIIKFDAYGLMQKEYAAMFGIAISTVNGIIKGRSYKHVTREHLPIE